MPRTTRTTTRSAVVATAAGLALALFPAAGASAHVRVTPDETAAGGFSVLTFRVPNESATAETSKVTVDLPTDTPFLSVSTKPVPGWTAKVEKAKLDEPVEFYGTKLTEAPSEVTWTADKGSEVADGQFQEFEVSVGPLPDAGTDVLLPAHQTYTDGSVVDWDEPTPAGGEEPEHPAPELTTTAAEGDDAAGAGDGATAAAASSGTAASSDESSPDTAARVLGGAGLLLGLAALVVAVLSGRRRAGKGQA
ncbi:YcnI family protein [Cellulomonas sp. PhB143]|uniref:YcnI family copper-binding membrane protein n=1 Tax=Cellulomonas sp. PhB143 TaxID=2485186 RepID=UPI000F47CC7C|nr:YcnI family protein [Cellulomonas sp. PhB143]ROS75374.1 uncharacterized protein YcnI [Cellulomonas sp. PhB143]